ncbi:heavy metal sensor histidine kinase [Variovorax sp. YR216]|uniref:heavy metal sensor histidine kinase n=1 Tax=Variovorax sp. YR216 TaxID=1882828 RepID=UPI000897EED0|nr:heavy metal sensor histidine kinase [Variovorax sp. YR216]SEB13573.1 two-component system, OmpR family, heavy metal sensor histidine kinase CusS [Variovorax sp. YR216]
MRNSIATRLALMFAAAALAVFALLGFALHHVLAGELVRHQQAEIDARLEDISYMLQYGRAPNLGKRIQEKLDTLGSADSRTRTWMWSDDPAYRFGDEVTDVMAAIDEGRDSVDVRMPDSAKTRRMRVRSRTMPATATRPAVRFMAGVDAQPFRDTLRTFETALLLLTLAGTGLAAALGYWIARIGLGPVERLSEEAQRIGPDNRALRLQLPALPRELARLGVSFNAALDRLDAAYAQLATFSDDVAHELRTPLANLIGQTQVALGRERNAPELREVLQSNLEEVERLRAIVADMLFLARAEQGVRARGLVASSIAQEVGKTVEFLDLLLDEAGMTVQVEGDAVAPIETSLFRRALTNLLQNAIQHSRPGAQVLVRIGSHGRAAEVSFSNPSAPIAPEQLARLFDRFYRIDTSRRNSGENHGLGLSIVKAVAVMHNGTVFARSVGGVTTVGFSVALQ